MFYIALFYFGPFLFVRLYKQYRTVLFDNGKAFENIKNNTVRLRDSVPAASPSLLVLHTQQIIIPHREIRDDVLNAFCWVHSTYTISSAFFKKVGVDVAFPGVDHSNDYLPEDKKFTKYYQWVGFILCFQVNYDVQLEGSGK